MAGWPWKSIGHKLPLWATVACAAAVILPFVGACWFSVPSADDFVFAGHVREMGYFHAQQYWYVNWTGRFTSGALISVFSGMLDPFQGVRLSSFLIVAGQVAAAAYLAAGLGIRRRWVLPTALCLTAVQLAALKSTSQGIFWMSGALTYQSGTILTLLLFGTLLRITKVVSVVRLAWIALLALLAAGANETQMSMNVGLLVLSLFAVRRSSRPAVAIALAATLTGGGIVLFAPGNAIRAQQAGMETAGAAIAAETLLQPAATWMRLLVFPGAWAIGLLMLLVPAANARTRFLRVCARPKQVALQVVALLGPLLAMLLVAGILKTSPPHRVINACGSTMVPAVALLSFVIALTLRRKTRKWGSVPILARIGVLAGFACGAFLVSHNFARLTADSATRARPYRTAWEQADEKMRALPAGASAQLEFPPVPKQIVFASATEDSRHWANRALADYNGLESVYLAPNSGN